MSKPDDYDRVRELLVSLHAVAMTDELHEWVLKGVVIDERGDYPTITLLGCEGIDYLVTIRPC